MALTALMDALLLIMFVFHHRVVRKLIANGLDLGFLIKLLVFSLFRTAFFAVAIASGVVMSHVTYGHFDEFPLLVNLVAALILSQSLYPLLVFVLFGMHRDIVQLWFPCIFSLIRRRTTDPESIDAVSETFTEHGHLCYDIRPLEPPAQGSPHDIATEETNICSTEEAKTKFM